MAKITELPLAGPITGAEMMPVVQDDETKRAPLSALLGVDGETIIAAVTAAALDAAAAAIADALAGANDPEIIRDTIAAALAAGSCIGIDPDDAANLITIRVLTDTDVTLAANSDNLIATQKAVKAFVAAQVAAGVAGLVNSAPGALDTLGEIATLLAADDSALGALTTTVAGKLAKASNLSDLPNVATALANLGLTYSFPLSITTTPSASEVLLLHVAATGFTIPANFAAPNSKGAVGTNPTLAFAIDVQRQVGGAGAFGTIGTITISNAGVFTFATAGGTAKAVAVGDVLKFIAPGVADATITNFAITVQGVR